MNKFSDDAILMSIIIAIFPVLHKARQMEAELLDGRPLNAAGKHAIHHDTPS